MDLVWDDACEGAFRTLKAALISAPMLAYPTRERHFTLITDASDVGIGAMLEQNQNEGGQVVKRVIAYASKTLSDTQHRYCTTNKELLAVVMVTELFRYYKNRMAFYSGNRSCQPYVASQLLRIRGDGTVDSTSTAIQFRHCPSAQQTP